MKAVSLILHPSWSEGPICRNPDGGVVWSLLPACCCVPGGPSPARQPARSDVARRETSREAGGEGLQRLLADAAGRSALVYPINEIDSIRTVAPRFREFSLADLRDELRRTLPKQFRIDGTGHFLICATKNSHHFGEICEDTYRTFYRYFTVRGFKISQPEFPLVSSSFPTGRASSSIAARTGSSLLPDCSAITCG